MVRIIEKPRLFDWMIPGERDHIIKCSQLINDYISSNPLFKGKKTDIGYFNISHEASFVAQISTKNSSFVFKSDPLPDHSNLEAIVLSMWKGIGVDVPHIVESGNFKDIEYFLMKKIHQPLLSNSLTPLEIINKNYIFKMGRILNKIHEVTGINYGQISGQNLIGEYDSITEYLDKTLFNDLTQGMLDAGIISSKDISKLMKCFEILETDISVNKTQSVLCHMDFYAGNVFKTDPLTIIDPDETIVCHPMVDLGSAIVKTLYTSFKHHKVLKSELIRGYTNNYEYKYDEKVLNAAIYIQSFRQMRSWYRKSHPWRLRFIRSYMNAINI